MKTKSIIFSFILLFLSSNVIMILGCTSPPPTGRYLAGLKLTEHSDRYLTTIIDENSDFRKVIIIDIENKSLDDVQASDEIRSHGITPTIQQVYVTKVRNSSYLVDCDPVNTTVIEDCQSIIFNWGWELNDTNGVNLLNHSFLDNWVYKINETNDESFLNHMFQNLVGPYPFFVSEKFNSVYLSLDYVTFIIPLNNSQETIKLNNYYNIDNIILYDNESLFYDYRSGGVDCINGIYYSYTQTSIQELTKCLCSVNTDIVDIESNNIVTLTYPNLFKIINYVNNNVISWEIPGSLISSFLPESTNTISSIQGFQGIILFITSSIAVQCF